VKGRERKKKGRSLCLDPEKKGENDGHARENRIKRGEGVSTKYAGFYLDFEKEKKKKREEVRVYVLPVGVVSSGKK